MSLTDTLPAGVVVVLFILVLMIMPGMGWAAAQSQMRHANMEKTRL